MSNKDNLVYEGGVDDAAADAGPKKAMSKEDRWKDRAYEFAVLESGLNNETGMTFERGCTDMICVVLFFSFLASMFGVSLWCVAQGNPKMLLNPFDYQGNVCGMAARNPLNDKDYDLRAYPKLYFTFIDVDYYAGSKLVKSTFDKAVCVKRCPVTKQDGIQCSPAMMKDAAYKKMCTKSEAEIWPSSSWMGYCKVHTAGIPPKAKKNWETVFQYIIDHAPGGQQMKDIYNSSTAVFVSMALAFVWAILYIYLMSFFAEYIAWGIIAITQLGLIGITIACFAYYATQDNSTKNAALALGICGALATLLFCIAVYCGWNSLKNAIDVIDASADFLAGTKRIIGVPFVYFVIMIFYFFFWIGCIISVYSMGTIIPQLNHTVGGVYIPQWKEVQFNGKNQSSQVNWILFFLTFGLIWFTFFLDHQSKVVTMVSACTYYFSSTKDKEGAGQVGLGFKWAMVNHFGSVGFGSLIIAIIFTIRVVVYTLCKKAEAASGENKIVKCITCLVQCFLKCLEEIIEYINKSAYAFMSMSGQSFCTSAKYGILLQVKHGGEFMFANYLAAAFIFLGKAGLTILNTFCCYWIMKYGTKDMDEISSPWGPLVMVALCTYATVNIFLSLFDESVLALMYCLCADKDIHGEPEWGPPTFHDSINKVVSKKKGEDAANDVA